MNQLSPQAFQNALAYVTTHGRAIDRARFAFYFENGSVADVLTALAAYQNTDGGFGRALEPDLRTQASSAVATQQGFNILRAVGATAAEPLVQRAVTYLLDTLDESLLRWEIVPPAVEDAPHAPWWTYGESAGSGDGFLSNPRAALIGFLCDYQALVPAPLLTKLIDAQMAHLTAPPADPSADQSIDMHALSCYVTLANSPNLPAQPRQQLASALLQAVQGQIATDPGEFGNYKLLPLDVASSPDALLAAAVDRTAIDAHLDYLIETQLPDGSWPIPWSWAFVDEAAWAQAEQDWKGQMIVDRLRALNAYGYFSL